MGKKYPFILQFRKGTEAADSYQSQADVQLFCSWSCRRCRKVYYEKVGKEDNLTEGEVIHMKCKVKSSLEDACMTQRDDTVFAGESWLFFQTCEAVAAYTGTYRVHMWMRAVELNLKL